MIPQAKELPEATRGAWTRSFPKVFRGNSWYVATATLGNSYKDHECIPLHLPSLWTARFCIKRSLSFNATLLPYSPKPYPAQKSLPSPGLLHPECMVHTARWFLDSAQVQITVRLPIGLKTWLHNHAGSVQVGDHLGKATDTETDPRLPYEKDVRHYCNNNLAEAPIVWF